MKQLFTGLLLCLSLVATAAYTGPWSIEFTSDQEDYIRKYKDVAMREMERTGVPASIKLAQGILESDSGKSYLARTAKNHFGIKCGSNWQGDKVYREDDDYDDAGRLTESCFREYRNPEASFVAHSEFLRDPSKSFRYGFLFRLEPTDYKGWAEGLRRAGYATNPRYPELLISIIERYNLNQYDAPTILDPVIIDEPIAEEITGILRTNDVTYFVSEAPLSIADIARQVDLSVRRLVDYNEEILSENQTVTSGERVYLQEKRRSYRGREQYHTVEPGEDLYDISQRYGLRIKNLAKRNRLSEQSNPATGEKIKLRGWRVREAPRLAGIDDSDAPLPGTPDIPTTDDGMIDMDDPNDDAVTLPPGGGTTIPPYTPTNPGPPPSNPNPIVRPGQPVITPPPSVPPTSPNQPTEAYHSVKAGETLYSISRSYGLSVDELKQLNGLGGNIISIGQQLRVR